MIPEYCNSTRDASFNQPGLLDLCPAPVYLTFMTALQNAIVDNDKISGFSDRVCPIKKPDAVYDFVVVGGGAAGSVIASRLSENPKWKVLLIEAGCDEPPATQIPSMQALSGLPMTSRIQPDYRTQNESHACLSTNGSCSWSSAKMLGGGTAHNLMIYLRGNPTDYNNWAELGNEGWSWDEVLPFFKKAEDNGEIDRLGTEYHSIGGPMSVERPSYTPPFAKVALEAATQLGYNITEDSNGAQITGFTIAQTTSKNGVRRSSAAAYLRPVRHRRNLHVMLDSLATKVIIKNGTAVGVQYLKNGELKTVYVTKEVILSAGSKRSPHLLLLSGVGPKDHLESMGVKVVKNLPGVGNNLHDHICTTVSFNINDSSTFVNNWEVAEQYLYNQTGPLSSIGLAAVMGLIATNKTTPNDPDIQIHVMGYAASCAPGDVGALKSKGNRIVSLIIMYIHPKSRGRITLASTDPQEYPHIWANYLSDPSDRDGLVEGVERALKFLDTPAFEAWNATLATQPHDACSQYTFPSTEYWKCHVQQGNDFGNGANYHDAGSCKMGTKSDPMAVVDPSLRVYGIKGLRVADASIMPQVTSSNTGAPSMMIGERAAAYVKGEFRYQKRHRNDVYSGYESDPTRF